MRALLIIIGIWFLINILFVVIMIPPRKPRPTEVTPDSNDLAGARIPTGRGNEALRDDDPPVALRHVIIAIALGIFFSLTPPLLEAYDAIRRKLRSGKTAEQSSEIDDRSLNSVLRKLRSEYRDPSSPDRERERDNGS